jgi:hypothetical protein
MRLAARRSLAVTDEQDMTVFAGTGLIRVDGKWTHRFGMRMRRRFSA